MKLAVMQPYFLPYIGYWQLIDAVDTFVIYDDVNYVKGGWINRNHILIDGRKHLFTIQLRSLSQFKRINEIGIADDFVKFQRTIEMNYHKAPHFDAVMKILMQILPFDKSNVANFIYNSIRVIASYLGITTELLLSSALDKDNSLKGQNKILAICKELGASDYYNAIGGMDLYSVDTFRQNGITLKFIQTEFIPYPQLKNECMPGLSILDVMMFNDVETIQTMLKAYTLV